MYLDILENIPKEDHSDSSASHLENRVDEFRSSLNFALSSGMDNFIGGESWDF